MPPLHSVFGLAWTFSSLGPEALVKSLRERVEKSRPSFRGGRTTGRERKKSAREGTCLRNQSPGPNYFGPHPKKGSGFREKTPPLPSIKRLYFVASRGYGSFKDVNTSRRETKDLARHYRARGEEATEGKWTVGISVDPLSPRLRGSPPQKPLVPGNQ